MYSGLINPKIRYVYLSPILNCFKFVFNLICPLKMSIKA